MPKGKNTKSKKPAETKKSNGNQDSTIPSATTQAPSEAKGRRMIRAIRVTPELLEAAKAYKKATGKSFYSLGLEAITERLAREGYIK